MLPCATGGWWREPQVPPLRFAPVGMTIYFEIDDFSRQLAFCNKIVPTGAYPDFLPHCTRQGCFRRSA